MEDKDLIYIVEDDKDILELITYSLKKEGFLVKGFERGDKFYKELNQEELPSVVILDIMLPDYNGIRIAKTLRQNPILKDVPIMFLTAKAAEIDKLEGFEAGADDYLTKPFSVKELIARIKALITRYKGRSLSDKLTIKDLEINLDKVEVRIRGKLISLTKTEFNILSALAKNFGKVIPRDRLIEMVWERGYDVSDRVIDVHIKHLRDKLKDYGKLVKTIRGVGYSISLEEI